MKMHALKRFGYWMVVVMMSVHWVIPVEAASLPRSTPEAQGVSSLGLLDLVQTLDQQVEGMHSLMVLRHGKVIAEGWWKPYDAEHVHILYSLSKSFTSTAVGLAVAEGKLSIDDEVMKFFPEAMPTNASANLKSMRVRDLLTMSTGHQDEPPTAPDLISPRSFLAQAVPHIPGTHFKYNTPATFMQSALVQKLTGQTVLEYLQPRLFQPLGIERPVWDTNFQGISLGGYGLRVRTEDIAKFGQLYLQKGKWEGKTLIAPDWVSMATSKQVSNGSNPKNDWNQGYGFQFWRCRNNAYRGDGAFGQYCVVLPDQDVVVAITSGIRDMQVVLNLLWDKLLPECKTGRLRRDAGGQQKLAEKLNSLGVAPAKGTARSFASGSVWNRTYQFETNEWKLKSLSLESGDGGQTLKLVMEQDGKMLEFPAGYGDWKKGRSPFPAGRLAQFPDEPVAGTFGWESDDTCVVKVCAYETPFHAMFRLKFSGNQVAMIADANVGFGPTRKPELVGRVR